MDVRRIFVFPDSVDETSARVVAAGVVLMGAAFLTVREAWILVPLVVGFAVRVLWGPKVSPLGRFAVHVATPVLQRWFGVPPRRVPGPPKRFAQLIGLTFTVGASTAWLAGSPTVTYALIAGLVVAASLEALAAICLGCIAYSAVWGCADCADISARLQQAVVRARQPVETSEVSATTT